MILEVHEPLGLDVGQLGRVFFRSGSYCYIGSGMQNLDKRVERHFEATKKVHWHIDHLTARARTVGALMLPSDAKKECDINAMVSVTGGCEPFAPGFGSSDCSCLTHLHRLSQMGLRNLKALALEFKPNPAV